MHNTPQKSKQKVTTTSERQTRATLLVKEFNIIVVLRRSHLTEVMVFFRLHEVKGFPLFFTCSCQQVVKYMVVSKNKKITILFHC